MQDLVSNKMLDLYKAGSELIDIAEDFERQAKKRPRIQIKQQEPTESKTTIAEQADYSQARETLELEILRFARQPGERS